MRTKNRKGRVFPLLPELRAVLERVVTATRKFEQKTGRVLPWLFHREGERIRSFRRAWITACRRAGLARVVERDGRTIVFPLRIPHDFRRTAVRNLERAGVPRSTAMAMVGHRTESIIDDTPSSTRRCSRKGQSDSPRFTGPSRRRRMWSRSGRSDMRERHGQSHGQSTGARPQTLSNRLKIGGQGRD
ncbi:MAG TPA: tyrosine-type recombinase/integrase [Patescibacteria group bacterium]|nr:tyrosine-type recombinase/integrase [Patescibacteria group bacterium]